MATFQIPDARLKSALAAGETVGCHWLNLGSPMLAELAADAGAQSIVLDLQHGSWQRQSVDNAITAIGGRAPILARVSDASDFNIGWPLDAGCHGVIVPMISSGAEAASVVAAAHFPPKGRRSGGGARSMENFGVYRPATAEHLLVSVMIETREGVAAAAEIAATPGLDMIFVGPSDLSLAIGSGPGTADFDRALTHILSSGMAAKTPVGIYTGDLAQAQARSAQGFQFVVVASDVALNRNIAAGIWRDFKAG